MWLICKNENSEGGKYLLTALSSGYPNMDNQMCGEDKLKYN